jgi:hypothetical protein
MVDWKLIISGRNKREKSMRACEKRIVNKKRIKLISLRPDWEREQEGL